MLKKLSLFFLPLLLFAKICSYDIDIKLENNKIIGKALLDFNSSIVLDPTLAEIYYIKNGTLELSDYPKYKKISKKPIEIGFFYKTKPIKNTYILFEPWYPKVEKRCKYEVKADFGKFTPIMQYTSKKDGLFVFDVPLKNLYIIASKDFVIDSKKEAPLTVSTYFYKKDSNLSKKYIEKSFEYFNLYKKMFGFLPYPVFNIVEIPYPGGYSMATMSVIGEPIINKDFVLNESLAHEIAHQWFGNFVFPPSFGNWCEGLTSYYSDYYLAKNRAEYRKNILIKYDSYVNKENEIPLIEFKYKDYEDKNVVGYAKGLFFFYMLRNLVGKESFDTAIKELLKEYKFKEASFDDIRKVFEKVSKKDLKNFFLEWVYRKGAFEFEVKNTQLSFEKDKYRVDFELFSNEYNIKVPLKICSDNNCKEFFVDSNKTKHSLFVDFEPERLVIDEEYKIFRRLKPNEIPPVISEVLGSDKLIVVCDEKEKYKKILKRFKDVKSSKDIDFKTLRENDIFIIGKSEILDKFAIAFKKEGDLKVEAFKNPLNVKRFLLVFDGDKSIKRAIRMLPHLGSYSTVIFKDKKIIKNIKPSQKGAVYRIDSKSEIVKVDVKDDFDYLIENIKNSKVVFVGENHPLYSHHINQLKIIKALYKNDKNIAIGMEMFQEPFQKYLDLFIEGKIDEKEMLKKTEYLKRWGYDYNLYRPILLYARKHKIKIVALNIKKEISQRVAKEGIDTLERIESKRILKSLDFTNEKYKNYIKEIFEGHAKKKFKDFENFYYAQILWDETMAKNIVKFLKSHPDFQMVVLAGNGHLRYGYGIPDRVKRRGIEDYKIVLQNDRLKPKIADFILYPKHINISSKRLGVYLKDKNSLIVEKVIKDSPAFKAGLKKGDKILKIDGVKLKNLAQLKMELIFVKNCAKLEILRDKKIVKKRVCFKQP